MCTQCVYACIHCRLCHFTSARTSDPATLLCVDVFSARFPATHFKGYEWKSDTYVLRGSSSHMHLFVAIIPHRIITLLLYGVLLKDNICSDPYMEVGYHLLQRAANCLVCSSCIRSFPTGALTFTYLHVAYC